MALRVSVILSVIALLVLAGLQYHWIGQITAAERLRLQRDAEEAARIFAADFAGELRGLIAALEPQPWLPSDPPFVAERFREWVSAASHPGLVKALRIGLPSGESLVLDEAREGFDPALQPPPLNPAGHTLILPLIRQFPEGRGGPRPEPGRPPGFREGRFEEFRPGPEAWIAVELDDNVIAREILPALFRSQAVGKDYRMAITAADRAEPVFVSGEPWSSTDLATPDYQGDLLGPSGPRRGGPGSPPPGAPLIGRGGRGGRGEPLGPGVGQLGPGWRLLVKHHAGSVETAALQFRRRNLAISFGVLVILGIGGAAAIVSGNRARRLGKAHLDFAAGVSHELRTPLAVIQSAAHNLRTGVVRDPEAIEQYAAIVEAEARRLSEMVEQVMTYSETQSGNKTHNPSAVLLDEIADAAIRNMSPVLRDNNATVRKNIDSGLPPAYADAAALTRSLQNLISNAVKYGQRGNMVEIEVAAQVGPSAAAPRQLTLTVSDSGTGVPDADVPHLFEAFYRGSNASTNTPGNGLGLYLVRRIIEAQGGSVGYERAPGGGARFTLTLPVSETAA